MNCRGGVNVKAFNDYSDIRLRGGCVYCSQPATTRDHVPAKALLDKPYPANLQVVPSCTECNNNLSKDEAYVAFLFKYLKMLETSDSLESLDTTSTQSQLLEERVLKSITVDSDGNPFIEVEGNRIKNVIKKFALCHVLYDLGEKTYNEPSHLSYAFNDQLTESQRESFNSIICSDIFPEVGSRAMQRIATQGDSWVVVQPNAYRYYIHTDNSTIVRIVIREILYCEVIWANA